MNQQKNFLDLIVSDLETDFPPLKECKKQFIERVEEIIIKNATPYNYSFEYEEKRLIGAIENALRRINNFSKDNPICIEELFIEYLARYCGYSISYLGLVINNMPSILAFNYYDRNMIKLLNILED